MEAKAKEDEQWLEKRENSFLLSLATLQLGNRLWDSRKDSDRAAEYHRETLTKGHFPFHECVAALERYWIVDNWDYILAFLKAMLKHDETWLPYLDDLIHEFDRRWDYQHQGIGLPSLLAGAADGTASDDGWDIVTQFFERMVQATLGSTSNPEPESNPAPNPSFRCRILLESANTLAKATTDKPNWESREKKCLDTRATIIHEYSQEIPAETVNLELRNYLARVTLDRAFRPSTNPPPAQGSNPPPPQTTFQTLQDFLEPNYEQKALLRSPVPACCLIRYHHRLVQKQPQPAEHTTVVQSLTRMIVQLSLDILSDDDLSNDNYGLFILARLLTSMEDVENTRVVWAMRNWGNIQKKRRWEEWNDANNLKVKEREQDTVEEGQPGENGRRTSQIVQGDDDDQSTVTVAAPESGDSNPPQSNDNGLDHPNPPPSTPSKQTAPLPPANLNPAPPAPEYPRPIRLLRWPLRSMVDRRRRAHVHVRRLRRCRPIRPGVF